MGDARLDVLHSDGKITLVFERGPDQRAMASLHALLLGGVIATLLYGAGYAILYLEASRAAMIATFFIGCAAFGAWNAIDPLLEPDYTTVFDLAERTVTVTERGWGAIVHGPVPFDAVAGLNTRAGYAASMRCVAIFLSLVDGEEWRLGYDRIWVRPATTSQFRPMIARLRRELGLHGEDAD